MLPEIAYRSVQEEGADDAIEVSFMVRCLNEEANVVGTLETTLSLAKSIFSFFPWFEAVCRVRSLAELPSQPLGRADTASSIEKSDGRAEVSSGLNSLISSSPTRGLRLTGAREQHLGGFILSRRPIFADRIPPGC